MSEETKYLIKVLREAAKKESSPAKQASLYKLADSLKNA